MERFSDTAIDIINNLHGERIDYDSEYSPLIDAAYKLEDYEDSGVPCIPHIDVLLRAIDKYGNAQQTDKAIEEMAELTQALFKYRAALKSKKQWDYEKILKNISEEMADVFIMLCQLVVIYQNCEEVQEFVESKIERLDKRLAEENNSQK